MPVWIGTCEVPRFDTADGLLGEGQYAPTGKRRRDGKPTYWVRRADASRKERSTIHPTYLMMVDEVPSRGTQVAVVGRMVLSEYEEDNGTFSREASDDTTLERLRTVEDEPQPIKRESR